MLEGSRLRCMLQRSFRGQNPPCRPPSDFEPTTSLARSRTPVTPHPLAQIVLREQPLHSRREPSPLMCGLPVKDDEYTGYCDHGEVDLFNIGSRNKADGAVLFL